MPIGDLGVEIALIITAGITLLAAMFLPQPKQHWAGFTALAGLAVAAVIAWGQLDAVRLTFMGTYALDVGTGWARLSIIAATAVVIVMSPAWFRTDRRHGEYYTMLLFSALGTIGMAGAADMMQLVISVLLSSVAGYTLAAYHRDWALSVEAGIKYFLLGALANAVLITGVILFYGATGWTSYGLLAEGPEPGMSSPLGIVGLALMVVGLSFKMGAVPAHAWLPDVAEGAPAPAAAFLTAVPKIGAAIALARLVSIVPPDQLSIRLLVGIISALTMTFGNLAALWQTDVRRLLGWSSVAQAGYVLMAVAVIGLSDDAVPAMIFFLIAYATANLAAFGAIVWLRGRTELDHYTGLGRSLPLAGIVIVLSFLSLVGIPPLAGFLGKLTLFIATIDGDMAWLAAIGAANSVLSLYFYIKVVAKMYFVPSPGQPAVLDRLSAGAMSFAAAMLLILTLAGGPILDALRGGMFLP